MARTYTSRERVDELINHFWRNGYLTLSRKFGKYLPEPQPIGGYSVEAIGKFKKNYVIGIILTADELNDPKIINKLNILASNNAGKYNHNKVTLYIGVPFDKVYEASLIIEKTYPETRKNIKIIPLQETVN